MKPSVAFKLVAAKATEAHSLVSLLLFVIVIVSLFVTVVVVDRFANLQFLNEFNI